MPRIHLRSLSVAAFLLAAVASASRSHAQATAVTVGVATDSNTSVSYPTPFGDFWEGSRQQFLFRASELNALGIGYGPITGMRWNVYDLFQSGVHEQLTIKLGTTSADTLSITGWVGGATTVYGATDYQPVLGQNTFTFNTPFTWNGTSNLVVEVCHGSNSNVSGSPQYTSNAGVYQATTAFRSSRTYANDDQGSLCGTTAPSLQNQSNQYRRPVTTFLYTSPCGQPGAATFSNVTTTSAKATWPSVPNTTGYLYEVTTSPAAPTTNGNPTNGNTVNLTSLSPGTSYYLHVRSLCFVSGSAWRTTPFATYAVGNCAPPDSAWVTAITATGATVNAPANLPGAAGYDWVITTAATPPSVLGWQAMPNGGNAATSTSLQPNTDYYAYVRARCAGGTGVSDPTVGRSFRTLNGPAPSSVSTTGGSLSFSVAPNPVDGVLSVTLDGRRNGPATLELLDGTGRAVRRWEAAGTASQVSVADLPAGLYLLRCLQAGAQASLRVQKL